MSKSNPNTAEEKNFTPSKSTTTSFGRFSSINFFICLEAAATSSTLLTGYFHANFFARTHFASF